MQYNGVYIFSADIDYSGKEKKDRLKVDGVLGVGGEEGSGKLVRSIQMRIGKTEDEPSNPIVLGMEV